MTIARRRARGRRPAGGSHARDDILRAAVKLIGRSGLHGVSIRGVARTADVDPALIYHYFPDKDHLFLEAMRRSFTPFRPRESPTGPVFSGLGEKVVYRFLRTWGGGSQRVPPFVGLIRASAEDARVASRFRAFVEEGILPAVQADLGPRASRKVAMVGSVLLGVGVIRFLLRVEPLASMPPEEVARTVGPLISQILRED